MFFRIFRSRDMEDLGARLAERFATRFPADLQQDEGPAAERKREGAISSIYSELGEYRKRGSLGLFRRFALGNAVRVALRQRGYRPEVVRPVVYDMLFFLAGRKG